MTSGVHIYAPRATDKRTIAETCLDCGKRTRMLEFFTPWHGWDSTCLRCGRQWQEGEWMPLAFERQSRQRSIARAKARWRSLKLSAVTYCAQWAPIWWAMRGNND